MTKLEEIRAAIKAAQKYHWVPVEIVQQAQIWTEFALLARKKCEEAKTRYNTCRESGLKPPDLIHHRRCMESYANAAYTALKIAEHLLERKTEDASRAEKMFFTQMLEGKENEADEPDPGSHSEV